MQKVPHKPRVYIKKKKKKKTPRVFTMNKDL